MAGPNTATNPEEPASDPEHDVPVTVDLHVRVRPADPDRGDLPAQLRTPDESADLAEVDRQSERVRHGPTARLPTSHVRDAFADAERPSRRRRAEPPDRPSTPDVPDDFAEVEDRVLAWLAESAEHRALFALEHQRALGRAVPEGAEDVLAAIERANRSRSLDSLSEPAGIDLRSVEVSVAEEDR